ncbi:hypothetical protein SLEP1_g53410 [Rubroshorea leprosula]|uniref:Uncharacterized protein n=1 Tax=Rubroshorea leprosula TaxID=152421 RepID=A0AAV5MA65_9ROSI|nr:hypothetical protein SLEP1_g53410 [Rubroshorea leprosula]
MMFWRENPVCVSCGLPKPCSPCVAREKWENFGSLSYVFKLVMITDTHQWELQTLAHVDMYFYRTDSPCQWD